MMCREDVICMASVVGTQCLQDEMPGMCSCAGHYLCVGCRVTQTWTWTGGFARSRALAKMSFSPEDLNSTDLTGLTMMETDTLNSWEMKYAQYPQVGEIVANQVCQDSLCYAVF